MDSISLGISIMPEEVFLKAAYPLFKEGGIDVIEWSFDTLLSSEEPEWLSNLLNEYGNADKLLGHGVYYSLFDAGWGERQENWLARLRKELQGHKYNHITEHFGFMSGNNHHDGAPLPVSLSNATLRIGTNRLQRLQDVAQLPVGVENLALAFCLDDVKQQGAFLEKMIDSVGGFIILDLHNIYCQAHNFNIDFLDLIESYPMEKVREIHISGGSWEDSIYQKARKVRRDTHNSEVPSEIFEVLLQVIRKCKHLEFIILEQLGDSFQTEENIFKYRTDYKRLQTIVASAAATTIGHYGKPFDLAENPAVDRALLSEQRKLAEMLQTHVDFEQIKSLNLKHWEVSKWNLDMVHTAREIMNKWNK